MATRKQVTGSAARELSKRGKRKLATAVRRMATGKSSSKDLSEALEAAEFIATEGKKLERKLSGMEGTSLPPQIIQGFNSILDIVANVIDDLVDAARAADAGRDDTALIELKRAQKRLTAKPGWKG